MKSVTAIMITGHRPERMLFTRNAVECFFKQRYRAKDLLIVNTGFSLNIRHPQVREFCLTQGGMKLGDLRNLALEEARAEYVIQWDDDDWYFRDRISEQMAFADPEKACLLGEQIRYSFRSGRSFIAVLDGGIDGTILHRRACGFRYPSMDKAEDTHFLRQFPERQILNGKAHLYVRFFHGANTWHERKIMHRCGRRLVGWSRALLFRRVLPKYQIKENDTPASGYFDPKAKVVTGIVSCQARAANRDAIRGTYFRSMPSPIFIVGSPDVETRIEDDTLWLQCDDTYEGLPQKMWSFYEWLLRASDFEYVFKVDDDCLVHLLSLYAFLFKLYASENRPDYIGGGVNRQICGAGLSREWHIGKVTDPLRNVPYEGMFNFPFCNGGYGVFLSRKAVEAIVQEGKETFFDTNEIYEDKLHGDVLCPRGMEPRLIGSQVVTTDLKPLQLMGLHAALNGTRH